MTLTPDPLPPDSLPSTAICAGASLRLGEPMAGTAPVAQTWLLVEQPGPWGRDAVTQSHLPAEAASLVQQKAADVGARLGLLRRPGQHPDDAGPHAHGLAGQHRGHRGGATVVLAHTRPGRSGLRVWQLDDPADLRDVDLAAAVEQISGASDGAPSPVVVAVCTNSRRDRCCALLGRPLAADLAADPPSGAAIWETSHTGGHRFAPTAVLLPHGIVLGRLDGSTVRQAVADVSTGVMPALSAVRGRSCWSPAGQAAELAVRELTGESRLDALAVEPERPTAPQAWTVSVHERGGGRTWVVGVAEVTSAEHRPDSCVKEPSPVRSLQAAVLSQ